MTDPIKDNASRPAAIRGWILVGIFTVAYVVFLLGVITRVATLKVVGVLPLLILLPVGLVLLIRRSQRDPAFARRVEEAGARSMADDRENAGIALASLAIALVVFAGALLVRLYVPGFAQLPGYEQKGCLIGGGLVVAAGLSLLWWRLRKRRGV